jgi:signal transduction histidine kinase
MEFTIYSIIYLITAVLSFLVAFLAIQRKSIVGAKELFWAALSAAVCTYFLFFESASTSVTLKIFFSKVSYLGVVTIPVFYLLFVLRFTKLLRFRDLKYGFALFVFPLITLILAFTNEQHHLIWSGFSPISEETNIMTYQHGFWFWVGYMVYSYMLLVVATYFLFAFNRQNKNKKACRKQGWLVAIAGLCPWVVSLFYITGYSPVEGLDITPISTTLSNILFTIAIIKSRFLNLVPVAREALMETLPVGILALDDKNRIQDINQVTRIILGVQSTDVFGMTPAEVTTFSSRLPEAIVSYNTPVQIEEVYELQRKSFNIVKKDLKLLKGSRLITIYDITDQKIKEKELMEAKRRAEESDNLKSAFLANMSHEIRTPMNCIMGFVSILQQEVLTDMERNEFLGIIKNNGDRLLTTLNDIIDISKIESGQISANYSAFDINEILLDMYKLFRPEAEEKGLDFYPSERVSVPHSLICSDKGKLYSVTTNLVKNALKYTNNGFVRYDCTVTETVLEFSVTDTGIGISPEKQKVVFDRFVQVDSSRKRVYEGSGLGLAISKAFVEMLGGRIWMESEEGRGSTFYVHLPMKRDEF